MAELPVPERDNLRLLGAGDAGPVDSVIRPLDDDAATGPGSLLPDTLGILSASNTADVPALVQQTAVECQSILSTVMGRFYQSVEECKNECQFTLDRCVGCLAARVDDAANQVSTVRDKLVAKILRQVEGSFVATVQYLGSIGLSMPPSHVIQQIKAGVKPANAVESTGQIPSDRPLLCPPGTHDEVDILGFHSCVPDPPPPPPPPPTCPPGTIQVGVNPDGSPACELPPGCDDPRSCVDCGPGQHWDNDLKACVPDAPPPVPPPPVPPLPPPGGSGGGPGGGPIGGIPPSPPIPPLPPPVPPPPGPDTGHCPGPQGWVRQLIVKDGKCCYTPIAPCLKEVASLQSPPPLNEYGIIRGGTSCLPQVEIWEGDYPPPLNPGDQILPPGAWLPGQGGTGLSICLPDSTGGTPDTAVCMPAQPGKDPPDKWHWIPNAGSYDSTGRWVVLTASYTYWAKDPLPAGFALSNDYPQGGLPNNTVVYLRDGHAEPACVDTSTCTLTDCNKTYTPPPPPPPPKPTGPCSPSEAAAIYKSNAPENSALINPASLPPFFEAFDCSKYSTLNVQRYVCDIINLLIDTVEATAIPQLAKYVSGGITDSYWQEAIGHAVLNLFGGWFGIVPPAPRKENEYKQHAAHQYLIPEIPALHTLNVRGFITDDEWKAAVAMNGECIPWASLERDATYVYPDILQTIRLYWRDDIDKDTYLDYLRKNGVKDEDRADQLRHLSMPLPGPSDLVRYMVRDVADPSVVQTYQLDAEFEQKFQGQVSDWAKWQGVDENVMRFEWYAHWDWPSNTELYEMVHRLRKDGTVPGTDINYTAVTTQDVIDVLGINDVAPVWRNRLAAISYRVPMRREIGKMYEVGVLKAEQLADKFQDIGYDQDNAESLSKYTQADSAERRAKFQGLPTRAVVIKLFKADGLSYDNAFELLIQSDVNINTAGGLLETAIAERSAVNRAKKVAALRKRFMVGDYSTQEVIGKLTQWGVASDRLAEIVQDWQEELSLKRKEPSVANLCEWAGLGYITTDEYARRLNNLGYTPADASHFMQSCARSWAKQVVAEAEKAAKKAEAQAKRDARCRPPSKPLCSPKVTHKRTVTVSSSNGKQSPTKTTDTTSEDFD